MTKVYENYVNGIKMLEKRTELIPTAFGGKEEKEVGQYLLWHENGQKASEGNYKDGQKDGQHLWWYEDGKKEYERNYKNGELDGLWTRWYKNGKKEFERYYKDGKEVKP